MNSQSLAISKLILAEWSVYLPISNNGLLIIDRDNRHLSTCFIVKATADRSRCPIGRVPKAGISVDADFLLFSDTDNDRCWLIPRADVSAFNSVRLGQRYNSYELGVVISTTEKDNEIKEKATNLIRALKG